MNTPLPGIRTREVLFSTLWVFALLNYLYCDILSLFDANVLQDLLTGSVGGMEMTQGFLLGASILMEIPIAMVLLSRMLPWRANRWANVTAGAIMTAVQIGSLLTGATVYYWFFSVIEIATTALIVYLAVRWDPPASAVVGGPAPAV